MFHVKHSLDDTITAIITPRGIGGVGVIRLSGDKSIRISSEIIENFPKRIKPRQVYKGWIREKGRRVDETLFFFMRAPNSFTGEDTVEMSCHGGTLLLGKILGLTVEKGARLAEPGEYSKRAYKNGKIGLTQAEAIVDLINAKSSRAIEAAMGQYSGRLSREISNIRGPIIDALAQIEAGNDFPDDVDAIERGALTRQINDILKKIEAALKTEESGRMLREGVRTAIVGRPNVGKSSLLNALLGEDRAIVTDLPGTTRDTIEEVLAINGLPLVIVDTAGIRHPKDKAEEFAVRRAKREIGEAELVLVVIDSSRPISAEDKIVLKETSDKKRILVYNKTDLKTKAKMIGKEAKKVSAITGKGIGRLKEGILKIAGWQNSQGALNGWMINQRHRESLLRAKEAIKEAGKSAKAGAPQDLISIDLKEAAERLGEIDGTTVSDEIVDNIFKHFCVGK